MRSIVVIDVDRIADSCGYSVPLMEYVGRPRHPRPPQQRRDDDYYVDYAATRNGASIDGLPGIPART